MSRLAIVLLSGCLLLAGCGVKPDFDRMDPDGVGRTYPNPSQPQY